MTAVSFNPGFLPSHQHLATPQRRGASQLGFSSTNRELNGPSLRFQGDGLVKTTKQKSQHVLKKLFGDASKNMMWTLGYSVGGVLLLPMPAAATGAFCMAGIHLASASYQFLAKKPDDAPDKPDPPKFAGNNLKRLSVLA